MLEILTILIMIGLGAAYYAWLDDNYYKDPKEGYLRYYDNGKDFYRKDRK